MNVVGGCLSLSQRPNPMNWELVWVSTSCPLIWFPLVMPEHYVIFAWAMTSRHFACSSWSAGLFTASEWGFFLFFFFTFGRFFQASLKTWVSFLTFVSIILSIRQEDTGRVRTPVQMFPRFSGQVTCCHGDQRRRGHMRGGWGRIKSEAAADAPESSSRTPLGPDVTRRRVRVVLASTVWAARTGPTWIMEVLMLLLLLRCIALRCAAIETGKNRTDRKKRRSSEI